MSRACRHILEAAHPNAPFWRALQPSRDAANRTASDEWL